MKQGFTLIELLAVIVILAIIALIAVPIVINIINDAKERSEIENLKLYEDAVNNAIARMQMLNPTFDSSECKIQSDGNLKCTVKTGKIDLEVDVKGKKPNKGIITIENNKISLKNIELNGKQYYTVVTLSEDNEPLGLSIGDKYLYKVNDNDIFTFYVLSQDEDKVNLIMNSNICNDGTLATDANPCLYAWHDKVSNNNYGPDTAMENLYNATKNWSNVPNMDLSGENAYIDENNGSDSTKGYVGITTNNGVVIIMGKNGAPSTTIGTASNPLKARLPKEGEVMLPNNSFCTYSFGSCPPWLVENLANLNIDKYATTPKIDNIHGYWLLSSHSGDSYMARGVGSGGNMSEYGTNTINKYIGLRAVITIPKTYLP